MFTFPFFFQFIENLIQYGNDSKHSENRMQFTGNSLTAFFSLLKGTHNNNGLFSADNPLISGWWLINQNCFDLMPFHTQNKASELLTQEKGAIAGFHSFHCYRTELRHSIWMYFCNSPFAKTHQYYIHLVSHWQKQSSYAPPISKLQLKYSRAHLPMLHLFFCL